MKPTKDIKESMAVHQVNLLYGINLEQGVRNARNNINC